MTNLWGVSKRMETRISHRSRRCTRDAQRVVTSLITYDRADVKNQVVSKISFPRDFCITLKVFSGR